MKRNTGLKWVNVRRRLSPEIYFHYLCFIGPKGGKGRTSWSLEIWFSRKSLFKKSLGLPYDKLISSKTNFFACKAGILKINLRSSFHLHLIDAGNHENDFSEIFIKNNDFWSMRLFNWVWGSNIKRRVLFVAV